MRPKELFAGCVFFFSFGAVAATCAGCTKERVIQSAENADALRQYRELLAPCWRQAYAADDITIFDRCSAELDRMLCIANPAFCNDGGAR